VRLVGAYQDRDGYTDDVTWHVKRDDVHWSSQRLGVTFRPTDRIENYLMVYGANSRNNGTGLKLQGFNIDGLKAVGFCVDPPTPARGVAVSCNVYRNLVTQAQELGPRAVALDVDEYQSTRTWGAEDTFRYQLNDELAIRNIVSYQRYLSHYLYDGDGSTVQQADVNPVRLPPGYKNATPEDRARDNLRDFTEELQVQGDMLDKHLVFTAACHSVSL
jgi:iron complex outermembrane receptor protein